MFDRAREPASKNLWTTTRITSSGTADCNNPRPTLWLTSFPASSVFPFPFYDFCHIQFPVQNGLAEAQLHRSGGAVCPSSCSSAVVFPVLRISSVPNHLPIPFPVSEECSGICDGDAARFFPGDFTDTARILTRGPGATDGDPGGFNSTSTASGASSTPD